MKCFKQTILAQISQNVNVQLPKADHQKQSDLFH